MAGGTWSSLSGKVRPGTYINFESTRQETIPISERGTVLLPLIDHPYGPAGEFITLENASPDAFRYKLGYSIYDNTNRNMVRIKEAFKNARSVIVYILSQGAKAKVTEEGLTATAQYGGALGNSLGYSIVANPLGGFDVTKYLGSEVLEIVEGVATIGALIEADSGQWIQFTGTPAAALTATARTSLTGGVTGSASVADYTAFLDSAEAYVWNTMALPLLPTGETGDVIPSIQTAVVTKIKYLRENCGRYRKAVLAKCAADYEGVINVTNGVVLSDGTVLSAADAAAWVAGADAGAGNTQSNTYVRYNGAVDINGVKSNAEAIAALKAGEFFFSWSEENEIVVEQDINSLTSFTTTKTSDYRKNRVIRVYDTFAESCMVNFPPNKFDNSATGWDMMEGIGRSILSQFEDAGAITDVNLSSDFLVDREHSQGDETYFNVGLQAVDSAEKLFFTIRTR